ncbi:MAG: hypothetical protein WAM65_08650, partial [Candidatus Korobacteraceae bacterium]
MKTLLPCLALFVMAVACPEIAWAQNGTAQPPAAEPALGDAIDCNTFVAQDANLAPISKLCAFALTYRSKLPDFIAQQTTTSHGLHSTVVITGQVVYRKGLEQYSRLVVNGKPWPPDKQLPADVHLLTNGEFGPLLINLFEVPETTAFQLGKTDTLDGVPVTVFDFDLPKKKNTFWA